MTFVHSVVFSCPIEMLYCAEIIHGKKKLEFEDMLKISILILIWSILPIFLISSSVHLVLNVGWSANQTPLLTGFY